MTATDTARPSGLVKPRLRGVTHLYAFFASLVVGTALVATADESATARVAATVYAGGLSGMLGASALLHRGRWSEAEYRRFLRLDHSMIFVMIAGTYTPLALIVLTGWISSAVLVVVWAGAGFGIAFEWARDRLPRGWVTGVYIGLGWVGVVSLPQLWTRLGVVGFALVLGGGIAYTVGAVVHATRRPDPVPAVFGYHEVFHAFVLVAVLAHLACVAFVVLPRG